MLSDPRSTSTRGRRGVEWLRERFARLESRRLGRRAGAVAQLGHPHAQRRAHRYVQARWARSGAAPSPTSSPAPTGARSRRARRSRADRRACRALWRAQPYRRAQARQPALARLLERLGSRRPHAANPTRFSCSAISDGFPPLTERERAGGGRAVDRVRPHAPWNTRRRTSRASSRCSRSCSGRIVDEDWWPRDGRLRRASRLGPYRAVAAPSASAGSAAR